MSGKRSSLTIDHAALRADLRTQLDRIDYALSTSGSGEGHGS